MYFVLIHVGKGLIHLYISILSCFSLEDFQLAALRYLTRPDLATSLEYKMLIEVAVRVNIMEKMFIALRNDAICI